MRFFLLDRVTSHVPGVSATGIKNVTLSDQVLHDHFPDYPVFPGTLVVEALAQLAGFLIEGGDPDAAERAVLAQIEKAKFHSPAGPGDQLLLRAQVAQRLEAAAQVEAEASVGERCVARARLTFLLRRVESERLREQRRQLYAVWTRGLEPVKARQ
jgi:3-hydroxyacyl-[acyl-carrier-protein] dehydratase